MLQEYPWPPPQQSWPSQKFTAEGPGLLAVVWLSACVSQTYARMYMYKSTGHVICVYSMQPDVRAERWCKCNGTSSLQPLSLHTIPMGNTTSCFLSCCHGDSFNKRQAACIKYQQKRLRANASSFHMLASLLNVSPLESTHCEIIDEEMKECWVGEKLFGRAWQREREREKKMIIMKATWALVNLSCVCHTWEI